MSTQEIIYQIRLLINDLPPKTAAGEPSPLNPTESCIFSDRDLEVLYNLEASYIERVKVKRAAARALRRMATDEVILSKKITTQDLSVDGPAVSSALLEQADKLDAEADKDAGEAAGVGAFWQTLDQLDHHAEGEERRSESFYGSIW